MRETEPVDVLSGFDLRERIQKRFAQKLMHFFQGNAFHLPDVFNLREESFRAIFEPSNHMALPLPATAQEDWEMKHKLLFSRLNFSVLGDMAPFL